MMLGQQTVLVTGISGNLGLRLLPLLSDFNVVGIDMRAPALSDAVLASFRFESIDLGLEASTQQLVQLLRETNASAVVHLAFVLDPVRTGVLDEQRMWQINVAGTARVMEAISVVNRHGGAISKFIFPSSVSVYGPETDVPVKEDAPLLAHTLAYAAHKRESDEVVQFRAETLGACSTYLLRPHIFAGASVQNYMIGSLRGTAFGTGRIAQRMASRHKRLPVILPIGKQYLENKIQFVHVDDMARLLVSILRRRASDPALTILNVAGSGEALTTRRCIEVANARLQRLPTLGACRFVLEWLWNKKVTSIPPDALPYMVGSYTMDTSRLRAFLGDEYESVIRYSCEDALADSFRDPQAMQTEPSILRATGTS